MQYVIRYWNSILGQTVTFIGNEDDILLTQLNEKFSDVRAWELETNDLKVKVK
jgi:hypothetical protein